MTPIDWKRSCADPLSRVVVLLDTDNDVTGQTSGARSLQTSLTFACQPVALDDADSGRCL